MKHPTPSRSRGGHVRRRGLPPAGGARARAHDPLTSMRTLRYAGVSMLCVAAAAVIMLA